MFPRYFHEVFKANWKVRIGQKLSKSGEPELIAEFWVREEYGSWIKVGQFRYLDYPFVDFLFKEVHTYVRSLVTHP